MPPYFGALQTALRMTNNVPYSGSPETAVPPQGGPLAGGSGEALSMSPGDFMSMLGGPMPQPEPSMSPQDFMQSLGGPMPQPEIAQKPTYRPR